MSELRPIDPRHRGEAAPVAEQSFRRSAREPVRASRRCGSAISIIWRPPYGPKNALRVVLDAANTRQQHVQGSPGAALRLSICRLRESSFRTLGVGHDEDY